MAVHGITDCKQLDTSIDVLIVTVKQLETSIRSQVLSFTLTNNVKKTKM